MTPLLCLQGRGRAPAPLDELDLVHRAREAVRRRNDQLHLCVRASGGASLSDESRLDSISAKEQARPDRLTPHVRACQIGFGRLAASEMQAQGLRLNKRLHNPYGDCVRLDIHSYPASVGKVSIHVDVDFSHMWENLSSKKYWFHTQRWRVKFGIRGGDLRFRLVGMSSPSLARRFRGGLPIGDTVEVSCAEERAESHKITRDFSFTGKASEEPFSIGLKHSDGGQLSEKANLAHKYQMAMVKIQATGNEDTPKWSFELSTPGGILQGSLACPLADLVIKEVPCKLSAKFMVSINDIVICDVNEIAYLECSPEKRFLIERRLQKYLAAKCGEHLSKVDISYDG